MTKRETNSFFDYDHTIFIVIGFTAWAFGFSRIPLYTALAFDWIVWLLGKEREEKQ